MNHDELARLVPVPDGRDLPADRKQILKEHLIPHATTGTGLPGIGIMWTGQEAKQVYKNEWIFDPKTLQFVGEKTFDPSTGKLNGESTIVQRAFVARAGQVPS